MEPKSFVQPGKLFALPVKSVQGKCNCDCSELHVFWIVHFSQLFSVPAYARRLVWACIAACDRAGGRQASSLIWGTGGEELPLKLGFLHLLTQHIGISSCSFESVLMLFIKNGTVLCSWYMWLHAVLIYISVFKKQKELLEKDGTNDWLFLMIFVIVAVSSCAWK